MSDTTPTPPPPMTPEEEYAAFLELKAEQHRQRKQNPPTPGTPAPWYTKRSWTDEEPE